MSAVFFLVIEGILVITFVLEIGYSNIKKTCFENVDVFLGLKNEFLKLHVFKVNLSIQVCICIYDKNSIYNQMQKLFIHH